MITIFGGIGRLRVRTSCISQLVRIDFYYTALSHFSVDNATLPSLDCITAFEIALELSLICEGCIDAYLMVLSFHGAVLLILITCDDTSAVSDVRSYAHLSSFRWYVLIYYTACSHFSVVNASLGSLDCVTAFELHFEYD